MKILLWSDDLLSRERIESSWKSAGAQMLMRDDSEIPDLIVPDPSAPDGVARGSAIGRVRGRLDKSG